MKNWRLPLVIALASLGLAACDVRVNPGSTQSSAPAETQTTAPVASTAPASPAPAADATSTTTATPAPMTTTDSTSTAAAPATPATDPSLAAPPTAQMGAAPATDMAAMPSDGVAAPTELQRFFEQSAANSANAAQGEGKSDAKAKQDTRK